MHHGEVGSISNTGKLMLTTGVAKGAVTGLEAGALAPEDRQALGLMSQVRYAPPTTPQHTATLQHDCNTATRLHFHNPLAVFVSMHCVRSGSTSILMVAYAVPCRALCRLNLLKRWKRPRCEASSNAVTKIEPTTNDQRRYGRWQMADGRWQMADGRWLTAVYTPAVPPAADRQQTSEPCVDLCFSVRADVRSVLMPLCTFQRPCSNSFVPV